MEAPGGAPRLPHGPGATYAYAFVELFLPASRIPDPATAEHWARAMLAKHGITVVDRAVHPFPNPAGEGHAYTLVLVLAASHMVIHTAPEFGWVHVVIATCGSDRRPGLEAEVIRYFEPTVYRVHHVVGGLAP